jgi:hypothetical protein
MQLRVYLWSKSGLGCAVRIRFRSRRGKMWSFRIWLWTEINLSEFIKLNLFVFVRGTGENVSVPHYASFLNKCERNCRTLIRISSAVWPSSLIYKQTTTRGGRLVLNSSECTRTSRFPLTAENRKHTAKTQYRKFETNIPRKGIAPPQSQFPHSCVCKRFIFSHDRSAYSAAWNYVDWSWEYINRSQTHGCGNWDWDRAIPFLGTHKWGFRCSTGQDSELPAMLRGSDRPSKKRRPISKAGRQSKVGFQARPAVKAEVLFRTPSCWGILRW